MSPYRVELISEDDLSADSDTDSMEVDQKGIYNYCALCFKTVHIG